jgi:hypothetical protein
MIGSRETGLTVIGLTGSTVRVPIGLVGVTPRVRMIGLSVQWK